MIEQPLFPFMKDLRESRRRRAARRAESRKAADIQRQSLRSRCTRRIITIVETVATARGIQWQPLFAPERGNNATASARVLAMGLCCAMDVPQYMVARAFRRSWATIFCAEVRCSKLYKSDAAFRKEWDRLSKSIQITP